MKKKIALICILSFFLLSIAGFSQGENIEDPIIEGNYNFKIFEDLRGQSLGNTFGYNFRYRRMKSGLSQLIFIQFQYSICTISQQNKSGIIH